MFTIYKRHAAGIIAAFIFLLLCTFGVDAQKGAPKVKPKLPEVKQIDDAGLKEVIQPVAGKPRIVNFWATWCEPCREEFPDLVGIAAEYKDRVDLITISLDDLAEIKREVPAFLAEVKAEMPAYLLKSQNEDAAISSLNLPWRGALPMTVLYNDKGEAAYVKAGKLVPAELRAEIDKLMPAKPAEPVK